MKYLPYLVTIEITESSIKAQYMRTELKVPIVIRWGCYRFNSVIALKS